MKILVLLAICVASATAGPAGKTQAYTIREVYANSKVSGRIIGGTAAQIGQFPWQVGIIGSNSAGSWICGGAVISDEWVLTAAHCLIGASSFTLYLGGLTLSSTEAGSTTVTTSTYIAHPSYNNLYHYDIGLIKLNEPIVFSDRIQAVQLPARNTNVESGANLTVSGWGKTSDASNSASSILNWVTVSAITNELCARVYSDDYIISTTLCTVGSPNHGTCSGDSGGPLVSYDEDGNAIHQGVVSFGAANACEAGFPSGYVRTSNLLDWISENTGLDV